jgi:4-amino-4-deoxychorismate lyase
MTLLAVVELGRGVVQPDTPVLYADDEGVLRGRAVFETLRVYGGLPFRLHDHLERLAASAARLGLTAPSEPAFAEAASLAVAAAGAEEAVLRLLWTPGREDAGRPAGFALVSTLPTDLEELRARGLRLVVTPWAPAVARAKSTSYAGNILARDEAERRDADDALLVDAGQVVLEAPTSNVWWREGDVLLTPSLELPILAGVTRAVLQELSPYTVEEGAYPLERLLRADEVFLSSSVREVMPVVAVNGTTFRETTAARALQQALRARATERS